MAKLGRVELGWAEGGVASMRGEVAIGLMGKRRCSEYSPPRTPHCCRPQNPIPNSVTFS